MVAIVCCSLEPSQKPSVFLPLLKNALRLRQLLLFCLRHSEKHYFLVGRLYIKIGNRV